MVHVSRLRAVSTTVEKRYGTGRGKKRSAGWKQFLKPNWFILAALILALSYFAFTALAPWQLNKDDDIVARNEQIEAAYDRNPVPVTEVMDGTGAISDEQEWTRVVLQGRYLPDDEVLLRMRPVDKNPAFQSLTPFELTSGEQILVHRGWAPTGDGVTVPEIEQAPTGTVSLVGMVRQGEQVSATRAPLQEQGYQQVYSISTEQISELTGTDLAEDYVQLSDGEPGVLYAMPVPKLDRGSHLSYGFQWIAIGIMGPLGLMYLVYAEIKERRKVDDEKDEISEDAASSPAGDPDPGAGVDAGLDEDAWLADDPDGMTRQVVRSRNVRDRYGDAKPDFYGRLGKRDRERF